MYISIRTKVFVLIVLANALMVVALLGLNAASFSRSFSEYVLKQESRRLEPLMQNISEQYAIEGDWDWIRWDNPKWISVLRKSLSPREARSVDRIMSQSPPNTRNFLDKMVLRDSQSQKIVIGRKKIPPNMKWLSIYSESGKRIAELGFEPNSRLDAQFDDLFAKQQNRNLTIIGVFGIIIAGALAIPFSGFLVRPIRKLTNAVREMTNGDLSVSVDESRNDELGLLAADFNRLAEVLKQNQQDRQQWVSDISHELRTPVAVLQADVEAAQDGIRTVDERWLKSMHSHAERLTRLVNDLHQLSQSDAGTLNYRFEPIDIAELLSVSVSQFEKSCLDCHIDVTFNAPEKPTWVRGDDARLNQLFSNLAQNTLRYTDGTEHQHGQLVIEVIEHENEIEVTWEDSAPGVQVEDLAKLFDRLFRVDESRSRESGGSGLGLAIVKNIVEAHSGSIQAKQSALGGLTLSVRLLKENVES